jgi:hypothetical protein
MDDLGVRANMHGHFETSVRLKECLFRSVRACFCPDGPHYRRNGDVTGLRFDPLDGNTAPQCVGQWLGCSESEEFLFGLDEVITDIKWSTRLVPGERRRVGLGQVTGITLLTSARTISWENAAARYGVASAKAERGLSEIQGLLMSNMTD